MKLKRKAGPDVWVLRWYDEANGTRTYRKRTLGTVIRYPHQRDAERAADALRSTINSEFTVPETVAELVTHYRENELTEGKKAYATIEANTHYLANHIVPQWGATYLQDVRTVDVELWLHTLQLAPGTRSKIRNIMSAVFNHAMYAAQEGDPSRRRAGGHQEQTHRLAQFPSLTGNQPASCGGRPEDRARTPSSRKFANHA